MIPSSSHILIITGIVWDGIDNQLTEKVQKLQDQAARKYNIEL